MMITEGSTWTAWDKAAGLSVHNESPSLLDELKKLKPNSEFHFLNRLDRETSGIVITTAKASAVADLQKVWLQPETKKIYVGIHRRGKKEIPLKTQIWSERLTDQAEGRKNPQGISANRIECSTEMTPLLVGEHLVLSAILLKTGRQHQIRRHSVLHGLELIGDKRYGDTSYLRKLSVRLPHLRLGLHAAALLWTPEQRPLRVVCPLPSLFLELFPEAQTKIENYLASVQD